MSIIEPTARVRAFAKLCATLEDIGGPGVDGAGIAGLYIASKIARFNGESYAISDKSFLDREAVLHVQTIVARADRQTQPARKAAVA